jgi:hypothetical protein
MQTQTIIELPQRVAGERLAQLAAQERRAAETRQRVRKLREKAFAEIERLIAFLDASDGYTMDEREEAVDDVPCDDRELEFSFCGVTADKCSMPHSEYDDELEEACEDEGAEHDGREPDEDGEPSLGWTEEGSFINDDDREAGGAARPPQNRTNLNTTLTVECGYRKFVRGLTEDQKAAVRERMYADSGVLVR